MELEVWDGFFHEMLNEPEKDRVRQRIRDWLAAHVPAADAENPHGQDPRPDTR